MNNITHYTVFGHVDKDDPVVLITSGFSLSDNDLRIRFIDPVEEIYTSHISDYVEHSKLIQKRIEDLYHD